jgi:uncharacterized protein YdcH (DUF465 family)
MPTQGDKEQTEEPLDSKIASAPNPTESISSTEIELMYQQQLEVSSAAA